MRIDLPTRTPAEYAEPPSGRSDGGLVLIPDIGGLRPLFDDHCARLARDLDVAVCAPEPFPGRETLTLEERLESMSAMTDAEKLADVHAAADHLDADRLFVLGFCMGGMYALKAAADPRFTRAVSFYGMIRVPEAWQGSGQGEPLEFLRERGGDHVLAIIGEEDPWTPSADVEALRAIGAQVVTYPGAEHGFVHDPERPAHRPEDAADAWGRVYGFLRSDR